MGSPLKKNRRYTYNDYAGWPDDIRCELIGGHVYDMTPAPGTRHQLCAGKLHAMLFYKMKGHACQVFIAPADVVFSKYDVVQPDVFIVCDRRKITEKNIQGAPDVIIEFLSPSTTLKDMREKKRLYEKHGVKEYLLIHPLDRFAMRYVLRNRKYAEPQLLSEEEKLVFETVKKVEIPLSDLFAD